MAFIFFAASIQNEADKTTAVAPQPTVQIPYRPIFLSFPYFFVPVNGNERIVGI